MPTAIPSYAEWKRRSALGFFHTRSRLLDNVDKALKNYWDAPNDTTKAKLTAEFDEWIKSKGANWKVDISRNIDQVVTEMYQALHPPYRQGAPRWVADVVPVQPVPGKIYLAQSFEYANSSARADVPRAVQRAQELIEVAYRNIVQARSPGQARTIFETWFGTYNQNRFATVFNNVKAIYDALFLKSVVLYYRGNGVMGASDCAADNRALAPANFYGAAWKANQLPSVLNQNCTYIFLGTAFFTSGVYNQDSTGGVLIHELSHAICGTDDVVYRGVQTYGHVACQQLAGANPDLAVHNADSYEYLCENYQNKLFQPTIQKINIGHPKPSINIAMRAPT
jgi:hypothetical protein